MTHSPAIPPGQQLAAAHKWPVVGESRPAETSEPWRVAVTGCVEHSCTWTLSELRNLPWSDFKIDIHCVTRWSKLNMALRGILVSELLEHALPTTSASFVSFVSRSTRGHSTSLPLAEVRKLGAFLAFEAEGKPLSLEHGGPVRVITPGRYFYKSLKWLQQIELLKEDRLGYWEAEAGYHNRADPWREERYLAANFSKQQAAKLLAGGNLAGQNLLSLSAADRKMPGLAATGALLRNADFRRAELSGADFSEANLSNANFAQADLKGASFHRADIEGADFAGADLRGADLRVLSLVGVSFGCGASPPRIDRQTRFLKDQLSDLVDEQAMLITRLMQQL